MQLPPIAGGQLHSCYHACPQQASDMMISGMTNLHWVSGAGHEGM